MAKRDRDDRDVGTMPFGDHLEELRLRIVLAVIGVAPILVGALIIGQWMLGQLMRPLERALLAADMPPMLQATSPLETFMAYVQVALVLTVLIGAPWILYQAWRFIAPGLYANERRFVYVLVPMSGVLTLASAAFLYFVMLPLVLAFFINFGASVGRMDVATAPAPAGAVFPSVPVLEADPEAPSPGDVWVNSTLKQWRVCVTGPTDAEPDVAAEVWGVPLVGAGGVAQQYRVIEYVRMLLRLAIAFALGFQMPVVVLLLGWAGVVQPSTLARFRRHIAIGCVALSAVLTPADPISMVALALPLYVLFELGSLLLRVLPAERVGKYPDPDEDLDEASERALFEDSDEDGANP